MTKAIDKTEEEAEETVDAVPQFGIQRGTYTPDPEYLVTAEITAVDPETALIVRTKPAADAELVPTPPRLSDFIGVKIEYAIDTEVVAPPGRTLGPPSEARPKTKMKVIRVPPELNDGGMCRAWSSDDIDLEAIKLWLEENEVGAQAKLEIIEMDPMVYNVVMGPE